MSTENEKDSEKGAMRDMGAESDEKVVTACELDVVMAFQTWTQSEVSEERRLVRKLDRRILPIVCLMYLFAFLDRSNLGNARLQGLPKDTLHGDPTGHLFDWVNSAFYFTHILSQVPATVISKLFRPSKWMGCAAIGWGICSSLMATAFNFGGVMASRLGMGFFEAGFGPGIPLYMSFYYIKSELGLRIAYWFGCAAVAGAFGGLIAFGVQQAHGTIANWRILFLIEGLPSIAMGLIAITFLPDRPESTKFLNEREREIAVRRMNRDTSGDVGAVVNRRHIIDALTDWRVHCGGVVYFGLNSAFSSISAFLPTIIASFGFTNANAQLLTVPPYAVAAIILCTSGYYSDCTQNRGLFCVAACALGGIGSLILVLVHTNVHARYFACFCITSGTYTTLGFIDAWFAHNLGSETKRATGIPMFMAIGQCGSILGSHIYPATEGPKYIKGFAVSCALEFLSSICSYILWASYRRDNRLRDEKYGKHVQGTMVDTSVLADKAPGFRYVP